MAPKVSVVMSVYNGERYLRQAVDSILNQTFTDFEFIIVDDGSTDDTPAFLDSYTDPRIVRLKNNACIGLTRSLNRGLVVAQGAYIARQDADDISLPARLEQQVKFLDSHPTVGLVGTRREEIDEQGRTLVVRELPCDDLYIRAWLLWRVPFTHGSILARSSLLRLLGGYREVFDTTQDYDLWLRLAECTQLANLPEGLYRYRIHEERIGSRKHDDSIEPWYRTWRIGRHSARQLANSLLARKMAEQRLLYGCDDAGAKLGGGSNLDRLCRTEIARLALLWGLDLLLSRRWRTAWHLINRGWRPAQLSVKQVLLLFWAGTLKQACTMAWRSLVGPLMTNASPYN